MPPIACGSAAVAGAHELLGVGMHEGHGHGHGRAVGQHERRVVAELLDRAEDVVPAARVEPGRVLAQRVEDLLHLERRGDRLDQHGRADRAARQADGCLSGDEDVVPELGLVPALELREVDVRAAAARHRRQPAPAQEDRDVEQAGRDGPPVDEHVALLQVPPARPHDERRELLAERVALALGRGERERAAGRVAHGGVAGDDVPPGRRERILEAAHEDARARVERVDDHLRIGGARQLDAPVVEIGGRGGDAPLGLAQLLRLGRERRALAGCEARLALHRAPPAARACARRSGPRDRRSARAPRRRAARPVRVPRLPRSRCSCRAPAARLGGQRAQRLAAAAAAARHGSSSTRSAGSCGEAAQALGSPPPPYQARSAALRPYQPGGQTRRPSRGSPAIGRPRSRRHRARACGSGAGHRPSLRWDRRGGCARAVGHDAVMSTVARNHGIGTAPVRSARS